MKHFIYMLIIFFYYGCNSNNNRNMNKFLNIGYFDSLVNTGYYKDNKIITFTYMDKVYNEPKYVHQVTINDTIYVIKDGHNNKVTLCRLFSYNDILNLTHYVIVRDDNGFTPIEEDYMYFIQKVDTSNYNITYYIKYFFGAGTSYSDIKDINLNKICEYRYNYIISETGKKIDTTDGNFCCLSTKEIIYIKDKGIRSIKINRYNKCAVFHEAW